MNDNEPNIEIEIAPEYIKKMQTEGMYAAMNCEPPEFPICPYYMEGYKSVKR
jgi:hypothetical protein